jgi:prophage regulatory protein
MKLIDRDGLRAKGINLNKATIWRKLKAGEFPRPILVGNRHAWVESEVDAYIEKLVAARDLEVA